MAATLLTAAMIIGTGIFGALGATADKAGSALLLAMIPGALVAWATGVSGAQLGVNFPEPGGAFVWARAFHYHSLGFIAGCCYLGQGIVGTGVVVLAIGLVTFALVLVFDLRQILPLASFYLLIWFAITHYSALQLKKEQRLTSPFFSWFGLVGCFVLLFFIPPFLLVIGAVTLALMFGARSVVRRVNRKG
jgi:APA family basic amino acid/polyamine antiporter